MTKIIGLAGRIGSGKSTVAREIARQLEGHDYSAEVLSFATPFKSMLETMLTAAGMTRKDAEIWVHDHDYREQPCPVLSGRTPRYALQTLGTQWGRDILSKTVWADLGRQRAAKSQCDVVIFDDVRFLTEVDVLGQDKVFLVYRGTPGPVEHESEALPFEDEVWHIDNNGRPAATARKIMKIAGV